MQHHCIKYFLLLTCIMKYIAVILSFLTIALSSIPCDDEITMSEQLVVTSQSSDTHSSNFTDLCTPFCSCVCCATVVIESNVQQNTSYVEIHSKEINIYNPSIHSSDFLGEILRPPRA